MVIARSFPARGGVFLILLAVGPAARAGDAAEALRWKFKAGDSLRYEFRQRGEIKVKAAGGPQTGNTTELTIELTWTVKGVSPDGTAELALGVEGVRSEVRIGDKTIRYDSKGNVAEDTGAEPLKAVYSAAVGADYALTVDARGRVIGAKVPQKVTESLRGSPFLASADGGSVLSEQGLKNLFAQLLPVLPEKPVGKGGSWASELELPAPPMRLKLAYKDEVSSLDDATAGIDAAIVTTIRPEPDAPFMVDITKQSGHRNVTLDRKAGRVTASTVKQSVDLRMVSMNRESEQTITLDEQLKLLP